MNKMNNAPITVADEAAVRVLIAHQRLDIGSCVCGWGVDTGQLGKLHSLHVWRELQAAGVVPAAPADGEDELREQVKRAVASAWYNTDEPTVVDAVMAVVRPLLAERDQARLGRADEKATANAALAAASQEQDRADRAEADLAAARMALRVARHRLDQVRRELTIERINPDDYAGSENWSEACYEIQAHDECDDPDCGCPCHAIVLDAAPADESAEEAADRALAVVKPILAGRDELEIRRWVEGHRDEFVPRADVDVREKQWRTYEASLTADRDAVEGVAAAACDDRDVAVKRAGRAEADLAAARMALRVARHRLDQVRQLADNLEAADYGPAIVNKLRATLDAAPADETVGAT